MLGRISNAFTLWFAFILLSLSYWKQHQTNDSTHQHRCDLLSFYYLCRTGNNDNNLEIIVSMVVICFHFTIFVVLETTRPLTRPPSERLWFAFILLSLSYWKQHYGTFPKGLHVVICFHFTIFVVLETTFAMTFLSFNQLWFAFILLSLSYWKQLIYWYTYRWICCDLLSFYYLCRTGNNLPYKKTNCLWLWFAFILLSLSYWKQPRQRPWFSLGRCDLLSFYYLCRTGNNFDDTRPRHVWVVICFHFTIFVVLETTIRLLVRDRVLLWFAFILLSLSYWKQHLQWHFYLLISCDLLSFYYLCRTGNNGAFIHLW